MRLHGYRVPIAAKNPEDSQTALTSSTSTKAAQLNLQMTLVVLDLLRVGLCLYFQTFCEQVGSTLRLSFVLANYSCAQALKSLSRNAANWLHASICAA